ncbi:MAG: nitroreductase family protein, partial [Candidatus Zixiibacteriota bacterium]
PKCVPLTTYLEYQPDEMKKRASAFYDEMKRRRTIREFSNRAVPKEIIENCIRTAGTAPSGANMQPWHFVVVSDLETKKKIRTEAEIVEKDFYERRAPAYWLEALAPLGTDENKPYLEEAPYVIVVFSKRYSLGPRGEKQHNYYLPESVGIATGFLVAAIHNAGLACLTHTPSPMGFLREVLNRPIYETPFIVLVVGYPKSDARVPDIGKKELPEIATFV